MQVVNSASYIPTLPASYTKHIHEIRSFLEVDRVCLYRFATDGSGQVVEEAVDPLKLPSLLNLRFPAEDIPEVARERFRQQRVRVIVDTTTAHSARQNPGNSRICDYEPADTCHVQYLRNLGVQAAITMPIVVREDLWGLVVVHHSHHRRWREEQLTMLELLSERLTLAITMAELSEQHEALMFQNQILTKLQGSLKLPIPTAEWQRVLDTVVTALVGFGGRLGLKTEGGTETELITTGEQPRQNMFEAQLERQILEQTRVTEVGGEHFPIYVLEVGEIPALQASFASTPVGSVLLIELTSGTEQVGSLTVFRPLVKQQRVWAGCLPLEVLDQPRRSFAPWSEWVKSCLPWSQLDWQLGRAIAEKLYSAIRQQQLEEVKDNPFYDNLTQLPNRHLFSRQLAIALLEAKSSDELISVIFFDLDRFERVNKTLGYQAGDQLLQLTAQRLKDSFLDANSMLAHWSGDKFVCLRRHFDTASNVDVEDICLRVTESFRTPFEIKEQAVYVSASLGIALAPYDGTTPEVLLLNAETAMYSAKKQGGNAYQFYTPALENRLNPLSLEADLRASLAKDEFRLDYQPQVDIHTGKVVAMEALIRWLHPERGLVSPGQFIPVAEQTDLICEIGEWTLRQACLQHRRWREQGLEEIRIAVNISARQFQKADFTTTVAKILATTQTAGSALEIEITEGTATRDINFTTQVMQELQDLGLQVALDDFGTGYSSLYTIKHFPINTLKVDKCFVQEMIDDPTDAAIVKAVIALGHGLDLTVLAEGVESLAQLEFLQQLGCDQVQGYYLSEPLTQKTATTYLQKAWAQERRVRGIPRQHTAEESGQASVATESSPTLIEKAQASNPQSPPTVDSFLLDQVLQQPRREKIIAQIAEHIHASLDLNEIMQTTVTEIREFLDTDRVILYQFSPDWNGQVVVEAIEEGWMQLIDRDIDDCCFRLKAAALYQQGRVSAIPDIQKANLADCHREMLREFQVQANLVVPIINEESLWGLIIAHHCRSPREWQPTEITLIQRLATQVAIAIHQAQLYQKLEQASQRFQQLAIQDGLTQLYNRRYFDNQLAKEWQRLQRQQHPISLIMVDIDYFKKYNDTYGHQAGDRCLQIVAQQMEQKVRRAPDFACRYGGEEFVIVLPETDLSGAQSVAQQLQQDLQQLALPHQSSLVSDSVTLSLGLASMIPNPQQTPSDLIKQADTALYTAKEEGRDRVVVSEE